MTKFIVTTPEFRLSFPTLEKPRTVVEGSDPYYGCLALFGTQDLGEIVEAIDQAGVDQFGERFVPNRSLYKLPLKPGKRYDNGLDYSNYTVLNLRSKQRPLLRVVGDASNHGKVLMAEKGDFYAGCVCTAEVMAYGYDAMGHRGVGIGLLSVTRVRETDMTDEEIAAICVPSFEPTRDL